MNDIVIRDARVVDGTGSPWFRADVAVRDGRIIEVKRGCTGRQVVNAEGRVLAPGFIDMHSHNDVLLLAEPDSAMKVAQGVTTEILGQDGISCAPLLAGREALVERIVGDLDGVPAGGLVACTVADYLHRLDSRAAVNIAYLLPHGTMRAQVLDGEERQATDWELHTLRTMVADGLTDGAIGMSTGLEYVPSRATTTAELQALLAVVAAAGAVHVSHIRDYDQAFDAAIDEMLTLGARTGVPVHLSHFVAWGRRNHGRMLELLRRMQHARSQGVDVTLDVYPYLAGSTIASYFLPDALRALAPEDLVARLGDPVHRPEVAALIDAGPNGIDIGWDAFQIASGAPAPSHNGRRLPAIAHHRRQSVGELLCDVIAESDGRAMLIVEACREDDLVAALRHPLTSIGSDGVPVGHTPHPRGWGTFARMLATHVRERGDLTLEQAVSMMSARPAARLRLADRGLVRPGMAADLVLFDPEAVNDRATYREPRALATGFEWTFVNGVAVWRQGHVTGDLPGRVLRSTAARA